MKRFLWKLLNKGNTWIQCKYVTIHFKDGRAPIELSSDAVGLFVSWNRWKTLFGVSCDGLVSFYDADEIKEVHYQFPWDEGNLE